VPLARVSIVPARHRISRCHRLTIPFTSLSIRKRQGRCRSRRNRQGTLNRRGSERKQTAGSESWRCHSAK
jgi:hypothetical protein